ncbi:hypothetical protein FA15DRAFT_610967 [Coprinopsis marcescibilis]|uniref:F-box domain-containing protein n=1 Tax=Coprinopsis marcescibilis TaxID=230819 RepID=A0A5C3L9M9_COPMA|nr:hypothetical protein FA15DRAFT_610967 [Coprinopsis marcescibilis]
MFRNTPDELTSTVCNAIQSLTASRKANFLLDTALALIDAGQYGAEVENYFDVYLKTPELPPGDVVRALLARGRARKAAGEQLLVKANQDFHNVLKYDPTNHDAQNHFRKKNLKLHFKNEPAYQRVPLEVWDRIASFIPRYHLRSWLFISSFYRDIAVRHIFHTLDAHFGEDQENLNRGLDIFDRAKADPIFANRVKCLRLHWAYEEGDMQDLMARIFRTALPDFRSLKELEWIGYPEMKGEMVQAVLASHPNLQSLGLIGWHFDAVGVSAFRNLRKFTLRAEDDDGFADMGEVRTVLDENEGTLRHLVLGAYLERQHSWDLAFQSATIQNLTHLDLVDTRISHVVLARIAHAENLQSLTLHGTFEEPTSATVVFKSDQIINGEHTFLPHLESFRFVLVGQDDQPGLYEAVTNFLKGRRRLRRMDLGSCPWELTRKLLVGLKGLRVVGVQIANLTDGAVGELVRCIHEGVVAVNLATKVSQRPINEYATLFSKFVNLSFLHLQTWNRRRPKPNLMSEKEFGVQTEVWIGGARGVAVCVPSLDFVGWHGEHFVVVRGEGFAELKDLPARRRLDCGKGVDLGGEDAAWLERKDVPMDYEVPGLVE